MNCKNCDSPINYRYPTVCPQCEAELPLNDTVTNLTESSDLRDPSERQRNVGVHVANVFIVLMTSFTGMFLGAIAMYFVAGIVFLLFLSGPPGTHNCGLGSAVAFLSILSGGFLGCTGGTVLSYRNRMVTKGG